MPEAPLYDWDAERALLGAMMLSADAVRAAQGVVNAADFHKAAHGTIFRGIVSLVESGVLVDPVALAASLNGSLEGIGGKGELLKLQAETPASANAGHYAGIIAAHARTRRAQVILAEAHEDLIQGRDWAPRLAELAEATAQPDTADRMVTGIAFMDSQGVEYPTIWGDGDEVLWAAGQSLFITGPTGVGKSTLMIQLVAARLGLQGAVLGYETAMTESRVLYLAMDRPAQILRLFKRRFTDPQDRDALESDLRVWRGPLERDLAQDPGLLTRLAHEACADTVIIDSLKDATAELSTDEAGGGINRALQTALAEGIEVAVLHHQRKGTQGAKPKSIEDMHGNSAFKNGAGSVLLLWGAAGDSEVELVHLKQPVMEVGPLQVIHDHSTGVSTVARKPSDPLQVLKTTPGGATAEMLAQRDSGRDTPTGNQIRKAERKLDALVTKRLALKREGEDGKPARYVALENGSG